MSEDLPAPQRLALAYATPHSRPAFIALLTLDARLGQILRSRREPLATQLRLAWWREMLERPPSQWPAGEPLLDALRPWRDRRALARLPAGWEGLLADELTEPVIAEFADARGCAFAALASELGVAPAGAVVSAARIWAVADLSANLSDGEERRLVVGYGQALGPPPRLPRSLRPLAVLAGLGRAALARGGGDLLAGPAGMLLALRIGVVGR